MRPFFSQPWAYPIYGCIGASFGYYLTGVDNNQMRYLTETRDRLIDKRRRRAEREGGGAANIGNEFQRDQEGLFASPKAMLGRAEGGAAEGAPAAS